MLCVIPLTRGHADILLIVVMAVLMPPCILQARARQLVIRLIYSSRPRSGSESASCRVGRTLSSLRPSEVISGSYVILSQGGKTSFMTSYLQPGAQHMWEGGRSVLIETVACRTDACFPLSSRLKHLFPPIIRTEIAFVCSVRKHHLHFV